MSPEFRYLYFFTPKNNIKVGQQLLTSSKSYLRYRYPHVRYRRLQNAMCYKIAYFSRPLHVIQSTQIIDRQIIEVPNANIQYTYIRISPTQGLSDFVRLFEEIEN